MLCHQSDCVAYAKTLQCKQEKKGPAAPVATAPPESPCQAEQESLPSPIPQPSPLRTARTFLLLLCGKLLALQLPRDRVAPPRLLGSSGSWAPRALGLLGLLGSWAPRALDLGSCALGLPGLLTWALGLFGSCALGLFCSWAPRALDLGPWAPCGCALGLLGSFALGLFCSWALGLLGSSALGLFCSWALPGLLTWVLGLPALLGFLAPGLFCFWAHGLLGLLGS